MNLEQKLNNARVELAQLEKQLEDQVRENAQTIRRKKADRIDTSLTEKTLKAGESTTRGKIETVKAEIADLEAQISGEDYQAYQHAQVELQTIKQQVRLQWGGNLRDFEAQWLQWQKRILEEKILEAIKKGDMTEKRARLYWLGFVGDEKEFEVQWPRWQKEALQANILESIKKGLEKIFPK
jgi:hypothetical protein